MGIETAHQLSVTREKLSGLERHYQTARENLRSDDRTGQVSLLSIARMINQMKEEIARYEARMVAGK